VVKNIFQEEGHRVTNSLANHSRLQSQVFLPERGMQNLLQSAKLGSADQETYTPFSSNGEIKLPRRVSKHMCGTNQPNTNVVV